MTTKALTDDQTIEIWKQTVEVQMHFNQMEMTVRNFFMTFVAAILAAIGLSVKDGLYIHVYSGIPLGAVLQSSDLW